MDFYGGWKTFTTAGIDVGAIYYYYPGSGAALTGISNTTELYIGGSWGPVSAKFNYAVSDFFSAPDSGFVLPRPRSFSYDRQQT